MNEIIREYQRKINDSREMIAMHERWIQESPSEATRLSLFSIQKRLRKLEAEFAEYQNQIDATIVSTPAE